MIQVEPLLSVAISTHTLRKEGDIASSSTVNYRSVFQPTPSARRVTPLTGQSRKHHRFQPTPSARRVTAAPSRASLPASISTHTLRKEGDAQVQAGVEKYLISTHTLRKEGDRRAAGAHRAAADFNPHPPQGG